MGSVYQRGPGNWWIKWREGGRMRYAHGYSTEKLAKRVLAKIVADIAAGRAGLAPDPKGVPPLSELADKWLERREHTHRSWRDDRNRWKLHLAPFFGGCRPSEVDAGMIRRFVEQKLAEKLSSTSVGHLVRLLSTFMADVVEQGHVTANPVGSLPRSTRRLYRNATDPRTTPFLEKLDDVRRVFAALPEPVSVAFAIGALAGLRTGEVLGLEWRDVDLQTGRLLLRQQVRHGRVGPLKDDESRMVPILSPLLPILSAWRLKTGGTGLLFTPAVPERGGREGRPATFVQVHTLHKALKKALTTCRLPSLTWYQSTRHTFASQFVLSGGSIEKLSKLMGHSSVTTTERYAHLRTDLFRPEDYDRLMVDLGARDAEVIPFKAPSDADAGAVGYAGATEGADEVTAVIASS